MLARGPHDFDALLQTAFAAGLRSAGVHVTDIGEVSAACARYTVRKLGAAGAVHIGLCPPAAGAGPERGALCWMDAEGRPPLQRRCAQNRAGLLPGGLCAERSRSAGQIRIVCPRPVGVYRGAAARARSGADRGGELRLRPARPCRPCARDRSLGGHARRDPNPSPGGDVHPCRCVGAGLPPGRRLRHRLGCGRPAALHHAGRRPA
ncbi:hypothetical protein L3476_28110 [Paenibacillus thiaminolyticus]|uniref:hypothetical protein n=1 Tax=Paenibacillus thiaminolyticus TaxID=49283 RepID=UPI002350247C|nr:hypothetical protein [Paenibacillus thiaminolyticus]WCR26992.1 hypothetical protein L3476_28110 [Paenibacillus thiaminolyticus]